MTNNTDKTDRYIRLTYIIIFSAIINSQISSCIEKDFITTLQFNYYCFYLFIGMILLKKIIIIPYENTKQHLINTKKIVSFIFIICLISSIHFIFSFLSILVPGGFSFLGIKSHHINIMVWTIYLSYIIDSLTSIITILVTHKHWPFQIYFITKEERKKIKNDNKE